MMTGGTSSAGNTEVTYYTVSDAGFFPGTVALLNSLRLSGNHQPITVLDVGLTRDQRARLEKHATLVEIPGGLSRSLYKAFPRVFDPSGVVVIIDSDMIVVRSLGHIIEEAANGRICVFPDHPSQAGRWFIEWEAALELKTHLRRQTYVNSGFIAFSTEHWPDFLTRLWEVSERVPQKAVFAGSDMRQIFWFADQDQVNALLMSEIPADGVKLLPAAEEVHSDGLLHTKLVDAATLRCSVGGIHPRILHYSLKPKPWDRMGWLRVRRDAYVKLFKRVVCDGDVTLRLRPEELPLWLRPSWSGTLALNALDVSHGFVGAIRRRLPSSASGAILRAKERALGGRRP